MEITICDPYLFHEKLILDHEITCKELKNKITAQFGRDTTNCTIYYNQVPLKDNENIQLNSSTPFIILDGDIEKMKNRTDNTFLYAASRFQKKQQYKTAETRIPHFSLVLNRAYPMGQMSDDDDDDDAAEDEDPIFYFANDNNSSDTNNENTDDLEENDDIDSRNDSDSETEISNDSSSENEDNDSDTENITPFGQNQHLVYLIPHYSQNRDYQGQNGMRRHYGGDLAFLNPYPPINLLIQGPQRRYQLQQERPRFIDFLDAPDSDGAFIDETLGNDNDDDDDENENENENENNGQLQIDLTPEERETVNRICRENERFDRYTIIQVFEACGRDADTTIQCLSTM